jgi:hypothetical protein
MCEIKPPKRNQKAEEEIEYEKSQAVDNQKINGERQHQRHHSTQKCIGGAG